MDFLIGSKLEFFNFLNLITNKDNVAILTHTDLDGIASAIFMEKILKSKKISVKFIDFLNYENNILRDISEKLKEKRITKIFITDISIDNLALEDFENLRNNTDVFLIDHHQISSSLKNKKNVIKTKSEDCASFVIYNLGKGLINQEELKSLVCAAMIADFSYKDPENLKFIQGIYPNITRENILQSEPGKIYETISSALIYFSPDLKKVYNLVIKNDIKSLEKYNKIIKKEIEKETANFWENAEYYPDKKLYFYYFKNKFHIKSIIATDVSLKKPEYSFVIITEDDKNADMLIASARNQSGNKDVNLLLKKAIQGLQDANAGGHPAASGGRFQKKDLNKFKENLLR